MYVFVDGCFWHGCPEHFVMPKTRREFWMAKIDGNRARDRDTDQRLVAAGLFVVRLWEHLLPDEAAWIVSQTYDAVSRGTHPDRPTASIRQFGGGSVSRIGETVASNLQKNRRRSGRQAE